MKGLKVVTIGGGSSYTPELMEGFIKRYDEFPLAELWLVDIEEGIVVVSEAGYRKCAVFVDELLDQQQVVIKSLDSDFEKHSGVAGGTILGNGRIALIIDIQGLVNKTLQGKINNSTN